MSSGDPNGLAARIESHVRTSGSCPSLRVRHVEPLRGGACQELFSVDLDDEDAGQNLRLVLRSDSQSSLSGSLRREEEYPVIRAAVDGGGRTPAVRWPATDLVRPGATSYFMDRVDGTAIGRHVVRNSELETARQCLPDQLAEELARIHSITPSTHPDLPIRGMGVVFEGDPVASGLSAVRAMLADLPEPHPALALATRWLAENRPTAACSTLVHGDFRTGNFLVSADGLEGLLDWEFAHWGAPEEDIAWLCMREWRFGVDDQPVGGFGQRSAFYAAYEKASGRSVNPDAIAWWEVVGNVRWAGGCIEQGARFRTLPDPDFEWIAIARRCAEMELEALRLIEERS